VCRWPLREMSAISPKVADAASELLQDVFGKDKSPCRLVYGVASLPLGTPGRAGSGSLRCPPDTYLVIRRKEEWERHILQTKS